MRCTTSLALSLLLVTACANVVRPPVTPEAATVVSDRSGEVAPAQKLDGPFERLEDSAPMQEANELAADFTGAAELRMLARHNTGELGEVTLVEFRGVASAGYCAVAVRRPDGWFVGNDFHCARLTSDGTTEVDDVTIEDRGGQVHIRFSLKADDANGGIGGDGHIDTVTVHAIDCALVDGQPACSPGPPPEV